MIVTPTGKIAQYYYGVEFSPKDIRLGLIEASHDKIGTLVDQVVLYCYHYDPNYRTIRRVITQHHALGGSGHHADSRRLFHCDVSPWNLRTGDYARGKAGRA